MGEKVRIEDIKAEEQRYFWSTSCKLILLFLVSLFTIIVINYTAVVLMEAELTLWLDETVIKHFYTNMKTQADYISKAKQDDIQSILRELLAARPFINKQQYQNAEYMNSKYWKSNGYPKFGENSKVLIDRDMYMG
jgi:hypothetical protein